MGLFRRDRPEVISPTPQTGAGTLNAMPGPSSEPFTMPIDDVFTITGRGTVVTGTVTAGRVRVGDEVTLQRAEPAVRTTVVGVEKLRRRTDSADAGENVGLLLRGVRREDLSRGDVVVGGTAG